MLSIRLSLGPVGSAQPPRVIVETPPPPPSKTPGSKPPTVIVEPPPPPPKTPGSKPPTVIVEPPPPPPKTPGSKPPTVIVDVPPPPPPRGARRSAGTAVGGADGPEALVDTGAPGEIGGFTGEVGRDAPEAASHRLGDGVHGCGHVGRHAAAIASSDARPYRLVLPDG